MIAKPFVKWAGGKGQLLAQLDELLPKNLENREFTYIEPFVGGGAMLFHMLQKFHNIKKVVINDINSYLVMAYKVIKDNPNELIERLSSIEQQYLALKSEEDKKRFFINAREIFNENILDDIDRVKYLIFLNRTCFNGLYRVNAKGKFNVPFGQYINPTICNKEIILADSKALNNVEIIILNGDFEQTINHIGGGYTFFYFDPPYRPLNATSNFTSYSKEDFNDDEQIRLCDFCELLDEKNDIEWMLSNADCSAKNPNDTFFEDLYADFFINRVNASRAINANPSKRGKLTELLISNYPPQGYGFMAAEKTARYEKLKRGRNYIKQIDMKKDFDLFMSQLKDTNATLDYYCDFKKITKNVDDIAISLNMLNYLLGKQDLRKAVKQLWARDSRAFDVMDILIATRKKDNKMFFDECGRFRSVHSLFSSADGVMEFLDGTGLSDVFKKPEVKDLVDYVFGVETGLDTNARKNRSGHITEALVNKVLTNAKVVFEEQVSSKSFPSISKALGTDKKVFDFVIKTSKIIYLVEVNFYSGGGSKLNEVARSYSEIARKINAVSGFEFVWITDGKGWEAARNKLEEAYKSIPKVYNLTTINEFVNSLR